MEEIKVKETRGRKPKYDFKELNVGEIRKFQANWTSSVRLGATRFVKSHGLDWKFRCYRDDDGMVAIIRIK